MIYRHCVWFRTMFFNEFRFWYLHSKNMITTERLVQEIYCLHPDLAAHNVNRSCVARAIYVRCSGVYVYGKHSVWNEIFPLSPQVSEKNLYESNSHRWSEKFFFVAFKNEKKIYQKIKTNEKFHTIDEGAFQQNAMYQVVLIAKFSQFSLAGKFVCPFLRLSSLVYICERLAGEVSFDRKSIGMELSFWQNDGIRKCIYQKSFYLQFIVRLWGERGGGPAHASM